MNFHIFIITKDIKIVHTFYDCLLIFHLKSKKIKKEKEKKGGKVFLKNGNLKTDKRKFFKIKQEDLQKHIFVFSVFLIPTVSFVVFWLVVNIQSVLNAFRLEIGGELQWSFRNWQYFWRDLTTSSGLVDMGMIIRNTLLYFFINVGVILPLSFVFSYFLYKQIAGYKFYRIIFFAPNLISAAVLATLYKFMLNPSIEGIVPQIYMLFTGLPSPNFLMDERYALGAVLVYCLWTGFSVNLVMFNGAMERIPQEVIEAAKLDGVGVGRELFGIILPMIWPTISTLLITTTSGMFMASGPLLLLTGGAYGTNSLSFWIYQQVQAQSAPYYPATVGFIFTLVGVPVVLGVKKLAEKIYPEVQY